MDLELSGLHTNTTLIGEDFRSLLNTKSCGRSGITAEMTKMISSGIASQLSKELEQIKSDFYSQILLAINPANTEKVLSTLQISLGIYDSGIGAKVDFLSNRLRRNPGFETTRKTRDYPTVGPDQCNYEKLRRGSQVVSQESDLAYDTYVQSYYYHSHQHGFQNMTIL